MSKFVLCRQPSLARALLGSPSRKSTSVGRFEPLVKHLSQATKFRHQTPRPPVSFEFTGQNSKYLKNLNIPLSISQKDNS
jgi:hypothetical protein